jgi:hypothetical protein
MAVLKPKRNFLKFYSPNTTHVSVIDSSIVKHQRPPTFTCYQISNFPLCVSIMPTSRFSPQKRTTHSTAHRLLDDPATVELFIQHLPSRKRTVSSAKNEANPTTQNPPAIIPLVPNSLPSASPRKQSPKVVYSIVDEPDAGSLIHVRRDSFKAAVHEKAATALKDSPGKLHMSIVHTSSWFQLQKRKHK